MSTPPTNQIKAQAAKGVVWTSAGQWMFHVLNALTFIAFTRPLTPEDFGIWALVTLCYEFCHATFLSSLTTAIVQKEEIEPEDFNSSFWGHVALVLGLVAIAQLAAHPLAALFSIPEFELIWRVTSCLLILEALNTVPLALLRRNFQFHIFALQRVAAVALGGCIGITAAFQGYGIWSLVIFYGVMTLTRTTILWATADWAPRLQFSWPHYRHMLTFSYQLAKHFTLTFIRKRFDDLLIGLCFGPAVLGFYHIAYRLLLIVIDVFNAPINNVGLSLMSRIQNEPEKVRHTQFRIFRLKILLALPAFIGMSLMAPIIIPLIFGEKWLASVPLLQVLSLSGIALSFYNLNVVTLAAIGKTRELVRLSALFTFISCVLYGAAAVWGNVYWITIACLTASMFIWPVSSRLLARVQGNKASPRTSSRTITTCLSTLVMTGTLTFIQSYEWPAALWIQCLLSLSGGVLSYTITLLLIDRHFVQDIRATVLLILRKTEATEL